MKNRLKQLANYFGYDILHLPTSLIVRKQLQLLSQYNINLVFDIGANAGQYAQKLRKLGYTGQIVSFEPLPDAFQQIEARAALDPAWSVSQTAIGNSTGEIQINVSKNSYSSSILNVLPVHVESAPESAYTHTVTAPIQTVDNLIDQYYTKSSRLFVKVDTQGYEKQVFEGSRQSLDKILGFQMELSLVPLYEGETLMQDMVNLLREYGFKLMLIEGGHQNYETGELLQVEGYFYRDQP